MKCPLCEKGILKFFADANVDYDLAELKDGRFAAINPRVTTVFDEVRGVKCDKCEAEINNDIGGELKLEEFLDKSVIMDEYTIITETHQH